MTTAFSVIHIGPAHPAAVILLSMSMTGDFPRLAVTAPAPITGNARLFRSAATIMNVMATAVAPLLDLGLKTIPLLVVLTMTPMMPGLHHLLATMMTHTWHRDPTDVLGHPQEATIHLMTAVDTGRI